MRRLLGRLGVGAVAAAAIGAVALGCGALRPRAYFAAERTRGARPDDSPIRTRNFIPVDSHAREDVRIACEARMVEEEPVEGVRVPLLHVRVYIGNYGRSRVELRPESFVATDDAGVVLPLARSYENGARTGVVLADDRRETRVDLIFRLPEGYDLENTQSFRLLWGFRLDDEEIRHETFFERAPARGFRSPLRPRRS